MHTLVFAAYSIPATFAATFAAGWTLIKVENWLDRTSVTSTRD